MLEGAGRMGLPAEFALTLGMMIRYLFVFGYIYRKVNESLATRCFDPFNPDLPYIYRLKQVGYTIGSIFIRSYEQGERVYTSMLCRGYGSDSHIFLVKKPMKRMEWVEFALCMIFIIGVPLTVWITATMGL
jgi:cobalt/nickel transport system permease protein